MTNTVSSVTYYPGYAQQQISENLIWQVIFSITNANPCVVTTVNDHGYPAGVKVRFNIPIAFGMQQLNKLTAQVIAITNNTMTLDLSSINFIPFAYPSPLPDTFTPPTVFADSSGPYLPPQPLPYGNQDSFEGVIFNNGAIGDPIS
jgi:hypothetical protein